MNCQTHHDGYKSKPETHLHTISMELQTKMQKRTAYQPTGLLMREESETPTLAGVAIVTDKETVLYEGSDWREVEVIAPSCITKEVIQNEDIKLNLLHERNSTFARCNKGKGSLILDTREDGLHFEVPVPDCDLGKRAKALVDNGTYTGCSFEFYPKDYEVSERKAADGKTEYVIRHTSFERIGAITIGMDPAYEQTSVNARELYREQHPDTNSADEEAENAKREAEEKAAAEAAEREKQTQNARLRVMCRAKAVIAQSYLK